MNFFVAHPLFEISHLTLEAVVGIVAGLYFLVRGFRMLVRKRLLINTPTSKIRSAALGLVEVSGLATGPYTLPSPIKGTQCFLYRTTAWQESDKKSGEWKQVAQETLHVPFFLDDNSGQLLIDPGGAELDLHRDFRDDYNDSIFSAHTSPQVEAFLARHGVENSNKIRIEECSIRPKSFLFVVGTLAENPGIKVRPISAAVDEKTLFLPNSGVARATPAPEVVRLSEPARQESGDMSQQSKIAAALTKAGITKAAAWEAAGVPYRNAALTNGPQVREISVNAQDKTARPEAESAFDLNPPVVLMKGGNNPAFLISWRSQHEVVRTLAWKSVAMIWGGGALTLLGIYVLIQQGS